MYKIHVLLGILGPGRDQLRVQGMGVVTLAFPYINIMGNDSTGFGSQKKNFVIVFTRVGDLYGVGQPGVER